MEKKYFSIPYLFHLIFLFLGFDPTFQRVVIEVLNLWWCFQIDRNLCGFFFNVKNVRLRLLFLLTSLTKVSRLESIFPEGSFSMTAWFLSEVNLTASMRTSAAFSIFLWGIFEIFTPTLSVESSCITLVSTLFSNKLDFFTTITAFSSVWIWGRSDPDTWLKSGWDSVVVITSPKHILKSWKSLGVSKHSSAMPSTASEHLDTSEHTLATLKLSLWIFASRFLLAPRS